MILFLFLQNSSIINNHSLSEPISFFCEKLFHPLTRCRKQESKDEFLFHPQPCRDSDCFLFLQKKSQISCSYQEKLGEEGKWIQQAFRHQLDEISAIITLTTLSHISRLSANVEKIRVVHLQGI